MADDSHLPVPGDILAGKYRVERLIGRGGMGAVFAAEHMLLNQRVAVKLLLGELVSSQEATTRFMNEARAAAQIQGDHVARVLDIGQLPTGTPYMVLEYLDGSDLAGILHQRGVLSVAEVADYALQAIDALTQAHAAGIVHRDLKPANLFLAKRHDGTSIIKVLDFGISKNLSPLTGTPQGMTQTRALLGSPEYMSPEQLRTPRGVDARTDIWSLGVILYELLTGKMPFRGEAIGELFMQIMEGTPAPARSVRQDIPAALDAAITRCLSRDPNARFQTVKELAAVLQVFASDQMRALMAARTSAPGLSSAPAFLAATQPMVSTANTAAPWANTGARGPTGLPDAKRGRTIAIVAASVLVLIVGIVGVGVAVKHATRPDAAAATQGLTVDSTATVPTSAAPATTTAAATVTAPAQSTSAVTTHPSQGAAISTAAPKASPAPAAPPSKGPSAANVGGAPAPVTPAPATPAAAPPAAAKNCNPNYFFDKDGRKHFKPECF
ncbi:MAG: serine/threonine protein kinase [Polyangiaceae bacterium]